MLWLIIASCSSPPPCHPTSEVQARRTELAARGGDDGRSVLAGMRQLEVFMVDETRDLAGLVDLGFLTAQPEVWARGDEVFVVTVNQPNFENMVECGCRNGSQGHPPQAIHWAVEGVDTDPGELIITDLRMRLWASDELTCPVPP
jgi:hypothetical protein